MARWREIILRAAANVRRLGATAPRAFQMQDESYSGIEDAMAFALAELNGRRPGECWAYHLNQWGSGRSDEEIAEARCKQKERGEDTFLEWSA